VGRDPSNGSPDGAKSVGAYYTPAPVARSLARWALRRPHERALDPAAGDGVFLMEAARRLADLGGAADGLMGIEMRAAAAAQARARLREAGVPEPDVAVADFLAVAPGARPAVDAVIGNPPYVRFQRLGRDRRRQAQAIAAAAGVPADPLASSWAAFVLHAERFLAPAGRLALVVPSEIGHARYARPVLAALRRHFARTTFVLFRSALFPGLDQGTVLLLADGHGEPFRGFFLAHLESSRGLAGGLETVPVRTLEADALISGEARLHDAWLPADANAVLDALLRDGACSTLATRASVSIGYVTGDNRFFHLSPERASELGIPARHLRPALFRGRALLGLAVTEEDWLAAAAAGHSGYLLAPEDAADPAVAAYLAGAERLGVLRRTKVRHRRPWYRVTRTDPPDLVLTSMSGRAPRLAVNAGAAAVCNTLHAVRLLGGRAPAPLLALAASTSLTELSAELEGHALGGGMLKLEPSEALRLLLPLAPPPQQTGCLSSAMERAAAAVDGALRAGDVEAARALADRVLLEPLVGTSGVDALRSGAERLRALRRERSRGPRLPDG